jgi:hypothetical protein
LFFQNRLLGLPRAPHAQLMQSLLLCWPGAWGGESDERPGSLLTAVESIALSSGDKLTLQDPSQGSQMCPRSTQFPETEAAASTGTKRDRWGRSQAGHFRALQGPAGRRRNSARSPPKPRNPKTLQVPRAANTQPLTLHGDSRAALGPGPDPGGPGPRSAGDSSALAHRVTGRRSSRT